MKTDALLAALRPILCDIFERDDLELTCDTKASDIEEWDSLAHIQIILAVSKRFNVHLTTQDIASWETVGSMVECLQKKMA